MFLLLFFLSTLVSHGEIPSEAITQETVAVVFESEKTTEIVESVSQEANASSDQCDEICCAHCCCGETTESIITQETTDIVAVVIAKPTTITITNAIEPSMLPYKHWTGTYTPEVFIVKINGTEIAQGAQHELTPTEEPIEISFQYSFMRGMRKGSKTVTYKLDENSKESTITFSWQDTWKLQVSNATPLKEIKT